MAARRAAAHAFVEDLAAPVLSGDDRHHLERVLRLRPGELVSVADGGGGWRLCVFSGGGSGRSGDGSGGGSGAGGGLEPVGEIVHIDAPTPEIAVGFALTKGDRPEWAVQKLTEIGVDRIVLLVTGRSVVRWEGDRADRHLDRMREVIRQAAMQSRRLHLPALDGISNLVETVASAGPGISALAVPGGDPPSLARPMILVGPEGGWTPEEEAAAPATIGLASGVLRTETASVVAGTLLVALRAGLVTPFGPQGEH